MRRGGEGVVAQPGMAINPFQATKYRGLAPWELPEDEGGGLKPEWITENSSHYLPRVEAQQQQQQQQRQQQQERGRAGQAAAVRYYAGRTAGLSSAEWSLTQPQSRVFTPNGGQRAVGPNEHPKLEPEPWFDDGSGKGGAPVARAQAAQTPATSAPPARAAGQEANPGPGKRDTRAPWETAEQAKQSKPLWLSEARSNFTNRVSSQRDRQGVQVAGMSSKQVSLLQPTGDALSGAAFNSDGERAPVKDSKLSEMLPACQPKPDGSGHAGDLIYPKDHAGHDQSTSAGGGVATPAASRFAPSSKLQSFSKQGKKRAEFSSRSQPTHDFLTRGSGITPSTALSPPHRGPKFGRRSVEGVHPATSLAPVGAVPPHQVAAVSRAANAMPGSQAGPAQPAAHHGRRSRASPFPQPQIPYVTRETAQQLNNAGHTLGIHAVGVSQDRLRGYR